MSENKIKKILLIDDDKIFIEMYEMAFALRKDYQLISAKSSREGKKMAKEEKPDLILLDLVFPKEEGLIKKGGGIVRLDTHAGYKILKYLKGNEETKNIPIVVLTNLADKHEDEKKAREMGAADYIVKAKFVPREVIEKIDKMFK